MELKVKVNGEFQGLGGEISGTFVPGSSAGFPGGLKTLSLENQDVTGSIGSSAFQGCSSLTSLTLPSGLTGGIGMNAFSGCSSLTSLTLPPGLTGSVGGNAFYGCSSLASLELPSGMTGGIGSTAFASCSSLEILELPSGMTGSIAANAFRECTSLWVLVLNSPTVMSLSNVNAFTNCPADIVVPGHLYNSYINAPNWSSLASRITTGE